MRKERLTSLDMLQVRKVIEHICEKMLTDVNDDCANDGTDRGNIMKHESSCQSDNHFSVESVELLCNDQVLNESYDLRTVKHFIWKSGGDLMLYYMPHKNQNK